MMGFLTRALRYQAVVFDMDGVLADTREWVVSAFHHTAAQHPYPISDDTLDTLFGQPLEVCYQQLVGVENALAVTEKHRTFQRANMHLVTAFEGIHNVLAALSNAGIALGIVTGRTHVSAEEALDMLALRPYFTAILGAGDTERHKPDPQPLLTALEQLQVDPSQALMVGDAVADILCGQRAGCDTAGALYGFVGPALSATEPTYLLNHPMDLLPIVGLA